MVKSTFYPSQPRDGRGRWTINGDGSSALPGSPVAYPGDFHDLMLKDQLERYLSAGALCVSEIRLQFAGETARLDILCVSVAGLVLGVGIKTGDNPDFAGQQKLVYAHAEAGAGVTSPDGKLSALGLAPNAPLPPFPIFILLAPGPGLPFKFYGPKPQSN